MADLYSIPGIAESEVQSLQAKGYRSAADLWKKLAEDQPGTLASMAADAGLTPERLAALLAADAKNNARPVRGGLLRPHWMDLVVLGCVVLLVWALFGWGAGDRDRRVIARVDLPAFHEIAAQELDPSRIPASARQAELNRYAGKYTTRKISAGTALRAVMLGSAAVNLKGLSVLRVALKLPPADTDREAPYRCTLIVSPVKSPAGGIAVEVTVLAYHKESGPAVTVALTPQQLAQVAPLIGGSNAYLAQPAP